MVEDILKPDIADGPPLFDLGINVAYFLDPFLPVTTKWLKIVSSFSFKNSTSSLPLAFVRWESPSMPSTFNSFLET
eukprot:snap_masked-scaffold_16-processed-gene-3.23-mRNA-1 protein AED:1.00 eAED:1.00 QI:0/0/0/0/1/1/2/0/75